MATVSVTFADLVRDMATNEEVIIKTKLYGKAPVRGYQKSTDRKHVYLWFTGHRDGLLFPITWTWQKVI